MATWQIRDTDKRPDKTVEPNAVNCLDCGQTWTGPDVGAIQNEEYWDTCPSDDTHVAEPVLVTKEALGLANDRDFLIERDRTYVYDLESD